MPRRLFGAIMYSFRRLVRRKRKSRNCLLRLQVRCPPGSRKAAMHLAGVLVVDGHAGNQDLPALGNLIRAAHQPYCMLNFVRLVNRPEK